MIIKENTYHNYLSFASALLILMPIALISGPFLPDLFIVLISFIFLFVFNKKKELFKIKSKFFIFFLIFYFYLILTSILSDNFYQSIKSSITYLRFGFFSLAIFFILNNKKNFIKYFYVMICFTLIILVFDGYFQFITGKNIFGFKGVRPDRLGGLFFDELILGSYLGKILPIFFTFYLLNKKNINRYYITILTILVYILVFLSGERSAFFTTTLYLIMVTPFLIGIKRSIIVFIFISMIFGTLIATNKNMKSRYYDQMLMHTIGIGKYAGDNEGKITFMPDHIGLFSSAIDIFQKNFFVGGGVKTFRIHCKNNVNKKLIELKKNHPNMLTCNTHPHNYYLQLLAETGLIGFLFVLAIFIKLIFNYFKQVYYLIKLDKNLNKRYVVILSGLIIYIWPLTTTGSFFNNWICSILFLQIGIYLYVIENEFKN
jgi:O-antigen ligase